MNLFLLIFLGIVFTMFVAVTVSTEQYLYLMFLAAIVPILLGVYAGVKDEQGRRRSFDVRDYDVYMDEDDVGLRRSKHDIFRYDDEEDLR